MAGLGASKLSMAKQKNPDRLRGDRSNPAFQPRVHHQFGDRCPSAGPSKSIGYCAILRISPPRDEFPCRNRHRQCTRIDHSRSSGPDPSSGRKPHRQWARRRLQTAQPPDQGQQAARMGRSRLWGAITFPEFVKAILARFSSRSLQRRRLAKLRGSGFG